MDQMADLARAVETAVVLIDQTRNVLSVTRSSESLFGRHPDELVGLPVDPLFTRKSVAAIEKILAGADQDQQSTDLGTVHDLGCCHADGHVFPAEISVGKIDYAGTAAWSVSITNTEDIQDSRQHSRRLVAEMNAVLNNASYGTLMIDRQMRIRHANAAFRKMWDIDEKWDFVDQTLEDLRSQPGGADICPTGGLQALRSVEDEVTEIRREDGRIFERRCVFLPSDNILLTYYDITNLAQQAETAKSNADRHTYAMQAADQAFWDWNLHSDKMVMGERFWLQIQRMYLGPEISSREFFDLVHEKDREFLEYTLRAFASGEVEDTVGAVDTFRINTPDGEERYFALGFSVVVSDAVPYLTGLIRDITEPRRLRRAITEARDEAREANRAKSDFLATMSHEIRTPMNGILGMAGLLLDTQLDATQRDYAQVVKESGESLLTIINDILDFSKFEAGRLELEVIEFDLQSVIEGACRLLGPRAHVKNLELETDLQADLPHVLKGDPGRLRQVVLNLIGNAIKFTDSGGITLRASVVDRTGDSARIRIEVIDTGIGVPDEKRLALFDKFSQADSSVSRRYGGTGLGLAICKSLITLMDGEIGVLNNEDRGSTFWFEIPLEVAPEPSVQTAASSDIAGLRICVIGVEDRDRQQFNSIFESWNMAVEVTASVGAAVDMIRQGTSTGTPFDFALLEVNSEDTDPIAFARTIHEDPETAGTHLILATSSGVRGEAAEMKKAGYSAYVTKPVERPILYQILSELAASKGGRQTPWLTKHLAAEHGRRKLHILVAEDNPVNQKLILALLEKLGHTAELAIDGKAALDLLEQSTFDVVLMDVLMPNMSGLEATEAIRALPGEAADIPVVALTASTTADDISRCKEVGMNDFLGKPVDSSQLADCLQKVSAPGNAETTPEPEKIMSDEIDPSTIDQLSAVLGPHQLLDLIETFQRDHVARIKRIDVISEDHDLDALKRESHDLKGTCGNMGFVGIATLAQEIHDACKNDDIGLALHKLKSLPPMNTRVLDWLEERKNQLPDPD